jgi:hypothetical protein
MNTNTMTTLRGFFLNSFDALRSVPENTTWHPEGNTFAHTALVYKNCQAQFGEIEQKDYDAILVAAMFHDVGKRDTLDFKRDGTPTAYNHADYSLKYFDVFAPYIFSGDTSQIELARYIIKYHMDIKFWDRTQVDVRNRIMLEGDAISERAFDYLSWFNGCDDMISTRGNITDEEFHKMITEASGAFLAIINGMADRYFDGYVEHAADASLYLVRGVPGAGKTTMVKSLARAGDLAVAADDYFDIHNEGKFDKKLLSTAHEWCINRVLDSMFYGRTIFVHNTFTQDWEMLPYVDMAYRYGYRVSCIIVENRHGNKSVHNVPDAQVSRMKKRFQIIL